MGEHTFTRIKKTVAILMAVFFIATLTAVSASAQPSPVSRGPAGHPHMRWDGHNMWDDDHNWRWDGHNWWDDRHRWRWDGNRWWNGNRWWDGNNWRR